MLITESTGTEQQNPRPDRTPKKSWQPTFTRHIFVAVPWKGITYVFTVDAQELVSEDIEVPTWDPTSGHEIELHGVRYVSIEPEYPNHTSCPSEPHRAAVETLRGIARWMYASGVDLWQVRHAWNAKRPSTRQHGDYDDC